MPEVEPEEEEELVSTEDCARRCGANSDTDVEVRVSGETGEDHACWLGLPSVSGSGAPIVLARHWKDRLLPLARALKGGLCTGVSTGENDESSRSCCNEEKLPSEAVLLVMLMELLREDAAMEPSRWTVSALEGRAKFWRTSEERRARVGCSSDWPNMRV